MVQHNIKLVVIPRSHTLQHLPYHTHSKASLKVAAGMVVADMGGHLLATMDPLHNNTTCLRRHRKVVDHTDIITLRQTRVASNNRMATPVSGFQARAVYMNADNRQAHNLNTRPRTTHTHKETTKRLGHLQQHHSNSVKALRVAMHFNIPTAQVGGKHF